MVEALGSQDTVVDFDEERRQRGEIKLAKPIQKSQYEADVTTVHFVTQPK